MQEQDIVALTSWLVDAGLRGESEESLIRGFGDRIVAAGCGLAAGRILVDTLHPLYEGRAFTWLPGKPDINVIEYGATTDGEALERWRSTPFYRLEMSGDTHHIMPLDDKTVAEFKFFEALRDAGSRHVLLMVDRFGENGVIGPAECLYSGWAATNSEGFASDEIAAMLRLSPLLALALKVASLARVAHTLATTYLGRDAGQRVLSGRIARGVAEEIKTVLWFSDLRNYTRISDEAPPEQLIPMLNDYADVIVSCIHWQGGDVLKLIGDGVLAIFPAAEPQRGVPCRHHRRRQGARQDRQAQREARGGGSAVNQLLPRPAHWPCVLWQYRQPRAARLHRHRPRRQRGQPYRLDVPLGRSTRVDVERLRRRPAPPPAGLSFRRTLCFARRFRASGVVHRRSRRVADAARVRLSRLAKALLKEQ